MSSPTVIVVGAGVAGLAAAERLRAGGCSVEVLERRQRAGGRATHDEREGFRIDSGPHLVGARDHALLGLVHAVGQADRMLPLRPTLPAQLHAGRIVPLAPDGWRGLLHTPGLRPLDALRLRRLARLSRRFAPLLDPSRPERAVRFDDRSIADFVRLYFGPSALQRWAAPLAASELHADVAETSRVLLWLHWIARRDAEAGSLRGGLGALAEALAGRVSTRLDAQVVAVERSAAGFEVTCAAAGGEERREADAVVLAVPPPLALALAGPWLASAERDVLGAAASEPAVVAAVALEGGAVPRRALRVRVPPAEGLPLATLALEPGGERSPAPPGGALALLVAHAAWSRSHLEAADDVVEKVLVGTLERILPEASGAVRFTSLRRHRRAFPRFDVGRFRQIARFHDVQRDWRARGRRLAFAGDAWVAPTLEGAVLSGTRAAAELLESFGRAAPPVPRA